MRNDNGEYDNIESSHEKENNSENEVSIHNSDFHYGDTLVISPEESNEIRRNIYLKAGINPDEDTEETSSSLFTKETIFGYLKKGEEIAKKSTQFVAKNASSRIVKMAVKLDNSLKIKNNDKINKYGPFDSTMEWERVDTKLPEKNGLYYISNGKDVDVTYYNNARKIFHDVQNIEIKFWSKNKVNLK